MSLAKETLFYGATTIMARLVNYALVPLHTSVFIHANDYGIISEIYAIVVLVNILYLYGMETTFFYFSTKKNAEKRVIFSQIQTLLILSTLFFSAFFLFFITDISTLFQYENHRIYFLYFIAIVSIDTLVAIPFAKLRLEKKKNNLLLSNYLM